MVAVAVIGAGVATAAGSAIAGSEQAGAINNAAMTAAQEQQWALQQQEQQEAPYTALGNDALTQLRALLGLPGSGPGGSTPSSATTLAALEANPGYQFAKTQGIDSTKNAATASGLLLSGNMLKGLSDYTTGLADSEYQQDVGDVMNAVGIGQAAASGTAANIGTAATNLGNIAIGRGQSLANIDANTLAGIERGIGSATSPYSLGNTLKSPSSLGSGEALSSGTDTAGTGIGVPWSGDISGLSDSGLTLASGLA